MTESDEQRVQQSSPDREPKKPTESASVPALQPLSAPATSPHRRFGTARQDPLVRFPAWIIACVVVGLGLALAGLIWFG